MTFEIKIEHDGMWPTKWSWVVTKRGNSLGDFACRSGEALTKDRARRKAIEAKLSMENEDVKVTL